MLPPPCRASNRKNVISSPLRAAALHAHQARAPHVLTARNALRYALQEGGMCRYGMATLARAGVAVQEPRARSRLLLLADTMVAICIFENATLHYAFTHAHTCTRRSSGLQPLSHLPFMAPLILSCMLHGEAWCTGSPGHWHAAGCGTSCRYTACPLCTQPHLAPATTPCLTHASSLPSIPLINIFLLPAELHCKHKPAPAK